MWQEHNTDLRETLQGKELEAVKGDLHDVRRGKAASSRYLVLHGQHRVLSSSHP